MVYAKRNSLRALVLGRPRGGDKTLKIQSLTNAVQKVSVFLFIHTILLLKSQSFSLLYIWTRSEVLRRTKNWRLLRWKPRVKGSPFQTWSRPVYSHSCYAYCQGFLPCNFYPPSPFTCIFPKPLSSFLCWLLLTVVSVWDRRTKYVTLLVVTDNWCMFPCCVPSEYK